MSTAILEKFSAPAPGIYPVADAFAGTVTSDVVKVDGQGALIEIIVGVGATGTSTLTVLACDDVTPSNTTAVPFIYRQTAAGGGDVFGAWTEATTAGYTTTAGSNKIIQIYVDAAELGEEGYGYVQLKAVEVVNSEVLAGVSIRVVNPRHQYEQSATRLT